MTRATDYLTGPMSPASQMLAALNRTKRPGEMYEGTVPTTTKERRRAANRVARRQRRINRVRA